MPEIIVKLGERIIHRYFFDKESLTVGRARDNDIVIENLSVSRNHAKIKREGDIFTLTDMNSANGTLVNGVRVTKANIVHNDQLTVGKHTLVFLNAEAPSAISLGGKEPEGTSPSSSPTASVPSLSGPKLSGLIGIITVTKGKQAGQVFRVHKPETTIGRAPESDIRLHDWFVSKKHAAIVRKDDNYSLKDLDSWRGTTVNGATVKEHVLGEGDEIVFGTTVLSFKAVDSATAEKIVPHTPVEADPEAGNDWSSEKAAERQSGRGSGSGAMKPVAPPPSPRAAGRQRSSLDDGLESARNTPTGNLDMGRMAREKFPEGDSDSIAVSGVVEPAPVVARDKVTEAESAPVGEDDEFAPLTDEELEALEAEADSHEGTPDEERENRRAAWELAHAEKEFELGKEGFSFSPTHEELHKEEEAFIDIEEAREGLSMRGSSDEISNRQIGRESAEEEKALFGGAMPDKEGEERAVADVALASPTPVADSRANTTPLPTAGMDSKAREIAMWEKALGNKSVVIRKNAAKELKKLTGKDYDWNSEPGGS
ncbi:MAG TPA: FHA domain-containing protein [Candidatus Sumerlaeota bacterium]|nr:FHA domain-containing protein [Candidatus Sumerlaeota bacterium]